MYIMFSTPFTCCSIGAATVSATTLALAPGRTAVTAIAGGNRRGAADRSSGSGGGLALRRAATGERRGRGPATTAPSIKRTKAAVAARRRAVITVPSQERGQEHTS